MKKIYTPNNAGFAIFMAVIVTGILTIIAFFITNMSTKEIQLANINKESGLAIFAANAGIECAMFWDSRPNISVFSESSSDTISCANNNNIVVTRLTTGAITNSTFQFNFNNGLNPINVCVAVSVTKNADDSTDIFSRGYNTCNSSDPKRVERGVEVHY